MEPNLPVGLIIEASLRDLTARAVSYYIAQRGNHGSGVILLKLNGMGQGIRLLIQQRGLDGNLGWENALPEAFPDEKKADDYIRRAISRDPDLWVIEIEDREMKNPFAISAG